MVYGGTAASALGSLLRKAQEDRQSGPHNIPQSAQTESPLRQQIQGPIAAPESVGSEKVVSLKGEMQPIQEGATSAPLGLGGTINPVVAPVTPPAATVMPPVTPSAPSTPSDGGKTSINSVVSSLSPASIGTSLMPTSMRSLSSTTTPKSKTITETPKSIYGNIPTGTITQGKPIQSKSTVAGKIGSAVEGALQAGKSLLNLRPTLNLPMFMSKEILNKAVQSLLNPRKGVQG